MMGLGAAPGGSKSPLPSPPPQAGEGTAMTALARAKTLGALRPAPSPACGGGVGRGCLPVAMSHKSGPLPPATQHG
jgi:hypothetical protein